MAFGANLHTFYKRTDVVPGTYFHKVNMAGYNDMVFQWVLPGAPSAITDATIEFYASPLLRDHKLLIDDNPINNDYWTEQTTKGAQFPSLPGETVSSDDLKLSCNSHGTVLVVITVTNTLTDFSMFSRGQER